MCAGRLSSSSDATRIAAALCMKNQLPFSEEKEKREN